VSKQRSYVIIGNGITGITAAETLRAEDKYCSITIVADDPYPPYYRPALKDYLGGRLPEEKLWARPTTFYQEQRVRFVSGRVVGIQPAQHTIQLHNGQQLGYHKLLLANGARSRTLSCPGLNLAGVTTLRTIVDYQQVLRRLEHAERIVVCGSGTLALESAETLRHHGYQVTHLLRNRILWSEVLDTTASDMVLQEEMRDGIDVRLEEEIAEIIGQNGQVTAVLTTRGARIPCDIVLIAIGIEPLIDFIQSSGIACGRGVQVDAMMRTNVPDIYAAGDVIETVDTFTGKTRVLGQWYPAMRQAYIAAYGMLGARYIPDTGIFYNATFLYGLDFVSLGITTSASQRQRLQEVIADPQPRNYRKVLLRNGIPVGALLLGDRRQAMALKRAIDHYVTLTPVINQLFNDTFQLDNWLDQQQVPPALAHSFAEGQDAHRERLILTGIEDSAAYNAFLVPATHPQPTLTLNDIQLDALAMHQPVTIGRQPGMTVRLDHPTVSRRHAEINYQQGHYLLEDAGSSYGTFVNGYKLNRTESYTLRHNDHIRFGDLVFRFQLRSTPLQEYSPSSTVYLHLRDTELQSDTTRAIPESLLNTLGSTPTLVLIARNADPKVVPLDAEKRLTIGRDKTNDLCVEDTACSRRHAEIFTTPDGFYIRDLGSSNGVFVNRVKITNPYHLIHGDRIVIGNMLLYFSFPQLRMQQSSSTLKAVGQPKTSKLSQELPAPKTVTTGLAHRTETQAFSKERVHFEIDMCIGCDRCMSACPIPMSSMVSIAELNSATISERVAPHVARFTYECIMCGSCVPVCPVDNHRDLLMLSLKQRLGVSWDDQPDLWRIEQALPRGWTIPLLLERLREHPLLSDIQAIPDNYLLHLFAASRLLATQPGETIFREGAYGRDLYLILDGSLQLTMTEFDEREIPVAILGRGEYAGEYGMLTGQPYPVTARTYTSSLLLQVPEQVMQRFMELVPHVHHFFDQMNATHSISAILKRLALFQGVADADIQALAALAQIKRYERNERLFAEDDRGGRPARETLHIILEGFVKVARRTAAGTGHDKGDERIIAYRQGGDYFAGGLDLLGDGRAVTVTSINRTRVAEIPRSALVAFFQNYPEVHQRFGIRLREYIESTISADENASDTAHLKRLVAVEASADPSARAGLHALVSDGVVEGTEVLVIDLDKCIHCNECEEACARRHGHSRMNRKGMVIGNISIATACRQCQDPVCMLCSRAGIARTPDGEVYITETCIGCGICAERCPYNAITIVDVGEEEEISRSTWRNFSQFFKTGITREHKRKPLPMAVSDNRAAPSPLDAALPRSGYEEMRKKIAIKCDLCAGYKDQACVEACPMGAAFRVQPTVFFGSTEEILRRQVR
jgi:NADPH-dependent 2,4-dienoyl-CoA reductase/sulfur reductase-like enzyme/pSer/pThr/pTyr-binding forkhead associated (FHA) protein/CRP-like cAMP-binding protein/Fe-S-cluster-containing hydrogenase component 2